MDKLGLGMQWLLGDSAYRPYILSTSTTRFALAGKDNEFVVGLEGGREGGRGGREGREGGDGGRRTDGGREGGREEREGGRRGMTVIHIIMAPQYLKHNHRACNVQCPLQNTRHS